VTTSGHEVGRAWLQLEGRCALVSGGTRAIGRAVAEGLADAGANVAVIGGSSTEALDDTMSSLAERGVRSLGLLQPLEDADGVKAAAARVVAELGPIDILVNVAAVRPRVELADITVEEWERVLSINLRAPFLLAQAVMPSMRERRFGRIINFSGMNAYWGRHSRTHVVTSKGGMVALTRALASECARDGVTVNTVVPGTIDTVRRSPEWFPEPEARRARQMERVPMARLGTLEEITSVILFIASPRSGYMTGQELFVSGGSFPLVQE
jgi:NAD(P)-dependent dehydrogenase (short-subunit alcohol dehydrogenase family)